MAAILSRFPNHKSTLISLPSLVNEISTDICLKDLDREPRGPTTLTSRDFTEAVTKNITMNFIVN